jgi:hypothetical protein
MLQCLEDIRPSWSAAALQADVLINTLFAPARLAQLREIAREAVSPLQRQGGYSPGNQSACIHLQALPSGQEGQRHAHIGRSFVTEPPVVGLGEGELVRLATCLAIKLRQEPPKPI